MEELVKRVIWIDKNIKNMKYQKYLEILKSGIKNSVFYPVESIEEAFDLIKNKKGIINPKSLFYGIKFFITKLFQKVIK